MKTNKTKSSEKLMYQEKAQRFHPYKTFLFFALLGSSVIFLAISFLYITAVSKIPDLQNFRLPKAFTLSTILMLFSSYSVSLSLKAFNNDSFNGVIKSLVITLTLTLLFCVSQFFGWKEMYDGGFFISTNLGVSYLYIISGLHLLHVLGGLGVLVYTTYKCYNKSLDMVDSLLFFSNKMEYIKLELLGIFWHFIDVVWLCLFLMFLFTF
ncbi:MAG TPA: cytochrome c oxidase subunit 3 [Bacteroidia bacterium]|nr:cytochrome c oxidase subunit 3 [Bacteroidia bacterium]HNU33831.1 cytochrome c oxidase subunit 3 [Bacteroidia bacterium]